jgi:peptidoglycan/xylan/chitin deacetylase (PgdA/CDA1 family)
VPIRDSVVITFDDGLVSQHERAVPALRKAGMPATFFVTTKQTILTNEQLRALDADELFAVESHGHVHVDHSLLDEELLPPVLADAYLSFQNILLRAPRYLAWPYGGKVTDTMIRAAKSVGFERTRSALAGECIAGRTEESIPSYVINQHSDLRALLSRRDRWPSSTPVKEGALE